MRISDWSSDVCSSDLGRDAANSGLRREPELPDPVAIARETSEPKRQEEFAIMDDHEPEDAARPNRLLRQQLRGVERQGALDPNHGIDMWGGLLRERLNHFFHPRTRRQTVTGRKT